MPRARLNMVAPVIVAAMSPVLFIVTSLASPYTEPDDAIIAKAEP